MADTVENFRTYFRPNKEQNYFYIDKTIAKAIFLLDLDADDKIDLVIQDCKDMKIFNYEDELIQVLMVLLLNAKEAIEENEVQEPFIKIKVEENINDITITIIDNAGGIDDMMLKEIYNPYFSTKVNNNNSGIGLYMSKTIVENSMKGELKYRRVEDSSYFSIVLKGIKNG